MCVCVSARSEADGDGRGYRSDAEQTRDLVRSIRRDAAKLSDKWGELRQQTEMARRKVDATLVVSDGVAVTPRQGARRRPRRDVSALHWPSR